MIKPWMMGGVRTPALLPSWKIEGVEWAGAIRTVGSGKNFSTLHAAIVDAQSHSEDCLFLVDAGTYTDGLASASPQKIYIRGLGAASANTVWNFADFGGGYNFGADVIIENVSFICGNGFFIRSVNIDGHSLKISNSIVDGKRGYPVAGNSSSVIEIKNSELICTDATNGGHLVSLDLSKVSLSKVSYASVAWTVSSCTNSLAVDDKATKPTAGYGPSANSLILFE